MIYKCIKEMCLPKCDGDGFEIPNEYGFVAIGSIWEKDSKTSIVGGDVHLDSVDPKQDFGWIEITAAEFEKNFVQIGREPDQLKNWQHELDDAVTQVCDNLCHHPREITEQEKLDRVCESCPISVWVVRVSRELQPESGE